MKNFLGWKKLNHRKIQSDILDYILIAVATVFILIAGTDKFADIILGLIW